MLKKAICILCLIGSTITSATELSELIGKWYSEGNNKELMNLNEQEKINKLNAGFKYIPSGYLYIDKESRFQLAPVGFQPAFGKFDMKNNVLSMTPDVGNPFKVLIKLDKDKLKMSFPDGVEQTFIRQK